MRWTFGLAIKELVETPAAHPGVSGFNPALMSDSSFLFMQTPGGKGNGLSSWIPETH